MTFKSLSSEIVGKFIRNNFKIHYKELLNQDLLKHFSFHALVPIAWLADEDPLMCCIVKMGRQIAKNVLYMFSVKISVSHGFTLFD